MVGARRKFNGKIFTLESSHTFKTDLDRRKTNLQKSGAKVRVVEGAKHRLYPTNKPSGRKYHHIYIRRKR